MNQHQTIFDDITTIICKSFEFYDLLLDQFFLKLSQLLSKSTVWTDKLSLLSNKLHCCRESGASFPHEVGNGEAGTSGDACCAMYENLPALGLHLLHPAVVVLKVLLD